MSSFKENQSISKKNFCKTIKSFLTKKGYLEKNGIMLRGDQKGDQKMISNETKFNDYLTIVTLTFLDDPVALNVIR